MDSQHWKIVTGPDGKRFWVVKADDGEAWSLRKAEDADGWEQLPSLLCPQFRLTSQKF